MIVAGVGIHSCILGLFMLLTPRLVLRVFGFPEQSLFFPSQSGIFLLILGICYLWALVRPAFVDVILFSKALAVAFLVIHVGLLGAPPILWAAAGGDAGMLVAVAIIVRPHAKHLSG